MKLAEVLRIVIPILSWELMAAIAGTFYLRKIPALQVTKLLVIFLWTTFFVEITALYALIAYYSDFEYFEFVKDTPFNNNYWIYNIYYIASYVFYIYYFRTFIRKKLFRNVLKIAMVLFVIGSLLYLIVSDDFFNSIALFTTIVGTLLLVLAIFMFYFELLRSDAVLSLKRFLPIYISVGVLIFNLCMTPVDIYSEFFRSQNEFYVQLRTNVVLYGNIFLYSIYIIGFIVCSRKRISY